jgi:hypothetical protein
MELTSIRERQPIYNYPEQYSLILVLLLSSTPTLMVLERLALVGT